MYNSGTEILFPSRVIPNLRALRGASWQGLVDHVVQQKPAGLDRLAFVLLMARLCACPTCHANSYRAMRGCAKCAEQAVLHFRGTDQDLLTLFDNARGEVEGYMGMEDNLRSCECSIGR
jgi:hypothetical protein